MEPQTPETSQGPAAPEGTPVAAGTAEPTAAAEQPDRSEATESADRPARSAELEAADGAALAAKLAELEQSLQGRTEDLQRLQAEYVNYKRRVDRDRDVARNAGIEAVVTDLMSVLDNLRIAREHEEMTGGLRLLVDELDRVTVKHGLETYGAKGEVFDPTLHEALMQAPMPGVDEPTVLEVMQVGYRFRGRVIRPARVAVGMPAESAPAEPTAAAEPPAGAAPTTGTTAAGDDAAPGRPTDRVTGEASGQ